MLTFNFSRLQYVPGHKSHWRPTTGTLALLGGSQLPLETEGDGDKTGRREERAGCTVMSCPVEVFPGTIPYSVFQ